jgi:hypothetical protein
MPKIERHLNQENIVTVLLDFLPTASQEAKTSQSQLLSLHPH